MMFQLRQVLEVRRGWRRVIMATYVFIACALGLAGVICLLYALSSPSTAHEKSIRSIGIVCAILSLLAMMASHWPAIFLWLTSLEGKKAKERNIGNSSS
jgi:hypothetical protein